MESTLAPAGASTKQNRPKGEPMTKLVDLLRVSAQRSNLNTEAADEIERLRAELEERDAAISRLTSGYLRIEAERDEARELASEWSEKGGAEVSNLRAELAETRANYEQFAAAMRQNLEDRDSEIERLRAELDVLRKEADKFSDGVDWIQRAMQAEAELDALKAWKEEVEKQEPVAWLRGRDEHRRRKLSFEQPVRSSLDKMNWSPLYARHIPPAPSVPDDVMRDAERYRWLRKPTSSVPISGRAARDSDVYDAEIDAAMAAAAPKPEDAE